MSRESGFRGKCNGCGEEFAASQMDKHIISCVAKAGSPRRESVLGQGATRSSLFGLRVWGDGYPGTYWIYLEARADLSLLDMDRFLRDLWLECCGHCSAFNIGNVRYEPSKAPPDLGFGPSQPTRLMKAPLAEVLKVGSAFRYEYDFGSTTDLGLKVLWNRQGKAGRGGVTVWARNEAPVLTCASCKATAQWICTECIEEDGKDPYHCARCVGKHGCEEDMSLPVVNSPRMGVCGYEGPLR